MSNKEFQRGYGRALEHNLNQSLSAGGSEWSAFTLSVTISLLCFLVIPLVASTIDAPRLTYRLSVIFFVGALFTLRAVVCFILFTEHRRMSLSLVEQASLKGLLIQRKLDGSRVHLVVERDQLQDAADVEIVEIFRLSAKNIMHLRRFGRLKFQ